MTDHSTNTESTTPGGESVSPPGSRVAVARELAVLFGAVPTPRFWSMDAWQGVGRFLTVMVILLVYDMTGKQPNAIQVAIMLAYIAPPIGKAVQRYRIEQRSVDAQRAHITALHERLTGLPEARLLVGLASLAQEQGRITGVLDSVAAKVLEHEAHTGRMLNRDNTEGKQ